MRRMKLYRLAFYSLRYGLPSLPAMVWLLVFIVADAKLFHDFVAAIADVLQNHCHIEDGGIYDSLP